MGRWIRDAIDHAFEHCRSFDHGANDYAFRDLDTYRPCSRHCPSPYFGSLIRRCSDVGPIWRSQLQWDQDLQERQVHRDERVVLSVRVSESR